MPYTAPPVRFDHELIIGDTYQPATVSLEAADGTAYPLDDASGTCRLRTEAGGEILLSPTVSIDEAADTFTWVSTAVQTAALKPGRAEFGLRITFEDGTVRTVLEGTVTIRQGVV